MSPSLRGLFGVGSSPRLPDEVRQALAGDRALAAARAEDGSWLVGTRDRLHALGESAQSWSWEQVLRADWDDDEQRLELVPVADFGQPVHSHTFVLDDAAEHELSLHLVQPARSGSGGVWVVDSGAWVR